MASSQVEIASSVFGCVLRDRNSHERCTRESTARVAAAFKKNLKELVRDHLHTRISISPSDSPSDENSGNIVQPPPSMANNNNTNDNNNQNKTDNNPSAANSKKARNVDQWAAKQARQMVSSLERQAEDAGALLVEIPTTTTSSSSPAPCSSPGNCNLGASSLVEIWEARLNHNDPKTNRPCCMHHNENPPASGASRTSSVSSSNADNATSPPADDPPRPASCAGEPPSHSDICEAAAGITEELPVHCGGPTTRSAPASVHFRNPGGGEKEKVRIVDIIRRLTCDGNKQEQQQQGSGDCPFRDLRYPTALDQSELRTLPFVVNSPKIRGRQAFHDMLQQMEQERLREVESLGDRQSVTKFNHRGRLQSMLRLRFLQRGQAIQEKQRRHSSRLAASQRPPSSQSSQSSQAATAPPPRPPSSQSTASSSSDCQRSQQQQQQQQGSSIMHLRERFNAGGEQATGTSKSNLENNSVTGNTTVNVVSVNTTNLSNASTHHKKKAESNRLKENSTTHQQQCVPGSSVSVPSEGNRLRENSTAQQQQCIPVAHNSASREGNLLLENSTTKQRHVTQAENAKSAAAKEQNHLQESSANQKQCKPIAENSVSDVGEGKNPKEKTTSQKKAEKNSVSRISEGNRTQEDPKIHKHCVLVAEKNSVSHIGEGNRLQENSITQKQSVPVADRTRSHIREGNRLQDNSKTQKQDVAVAANAVTHVGEGNLLQENSTAKKQDVYLAQNFISQIHGGNELQPKPACKPPQCVSKAENSVPHIPKPNVPKENSTTRQQIAENSESYKWEGHRDVTEKINVSPNHVAWQELSLEVGNLVRQQTSETLTSSNDWEAIGIEEEEEEEEEEYEDADDQQDYYEDSYDWFSEIARPRSYWEDIRQAWYNEVLTTTSDNDERRKLLERRTVSSFLASDLRERIDQVMVSRVQMQAIQDDEDLDEDVQERMGQLMLSYFQRHSHPEESQEEVQEQAVHERERETEEEPLSMGEAESQTSHQLDTATSFDQSSQSMRSPSPFRPWNYRDYHECSDDSDRAPTTPPRPPLPNQTLNQDRRCSSSMSHSSTLQEFELIYDLKGQMEQLQREMFDLRQSIQSCIQMQVSLANLLKQEVHPDVDICAPVSSAHRNFNEAVGDVQCVKLRYWMWCRHV
ncbi:hypothetical protein Tsubulata_005878 [Turnera subulata]|uniref:Uncharacterized protein n=1 Tax=Turnera subulata TaxID=218843 RepID=A0A9Q0JIN0_9ROSI|nr:hypothetical protein Tsubulata_005878 [Turnera subulata]